MQRKGGIKSLSLPAGLRIHTQPGAGVSKLGSWLRVAEATGKGNPACG